MDSNPNIETVLWTEEQISQRVSELAAQITYDFSKNCSSTESSSASSAPVIVGVATGAFLFLADLVRRIQLPITVDFIRVQSYGSGTVSNGRPLISWDFKLDVRDKHVILVEDIVDTGNTLAVLIDHLRSKGASSVSVCTLLNKPSRRKVNFELFGDGKFYCGFECLMSVCCTNHFYCVMVLEKGVLGLRFFPQKVPRLFCGGIWIGLCGAI